MQEKNKGILQEKFIVPPFSILNTQSIYWTNRKKLWLKYGINNTETRENLHSNLYDFGRKCNVSNSWGNVFDPVLAEILISWFSHRGDKILDPFAGGIPRGIISMFYKRKYKGIDIRPEQIASNKQYIREHFQQNTNLIEYVIGDANVELQKIENNSYDLLLTCPPYFNLEKYSDFDKDLSNQNKADFVKLYESILTQSFEKIKNNRFLAIILGNVRVKPNTQYFDLIGLTTNIIENLGGYLYNEMIYKQPLASAPMRATRYMKFRKIAKVHQNVLIYLKGDYQKASKRLGESVDVLSVNDIISFFQ